MKANTENIAIRRHHQSGNKQEQLFVFQGWPPYRMNLNFKQNDTHYPFFFGMNFKPISET